MNKDLIVLFALALGLFSMQSIGGWFQIRNYRSSVRRVHQLGNVGIGQKRGGLLSGYLVLIACDAHGIITGAEVMEGMTFLATFQPKEQLLGRKLLGSSIDDFLEDFQKLDKRGRKRWKGYIQAIEALDMRLHPKRWEETAQVLRTEPQAPEQ